MMNIKFSQNETINLLNKRDNFVFGGEKIHVLSNMHCCLIILIENNLVKESHANDSKELELLEEFRNYLESNKITSPLIVDMDKLEHAICSAERRNANKSLDYLFIVKTSENNLFSLVGDFKLNRKNISNPYKDLIEKTENSKKWIGKFGFPIYEKIYIIYPYDLIDVLRSNLNRRYQAEEKDNESLSEFEFITLEDFLNFFKVTE